MSEHRNEPRTVTVEQALALLTVKPRDLAHTVVDLHDRLNDAQRIIAADGERIAQLQSELASAKDRGEVLAQSFDDLVIDVWRAVTGNTHEGPAGRDELLDACREARSRTVQLRHALELLEDTACRLRADYGPRCPGCISDECDDCEKRAEFDSALQRAAALLDESKGWVQSS